MMRLKNNFLTRYYSIDLRIAYKMIFYDIMTKEENTLSIIPG